MSSSATLIESPYMIYPWNPDTPGPTEDVLVRIFHRLKAEGLYETCFHENPTMSFSDFMRFFTKPNTLLQLCVVTDDDGVPQDIAGLTWLSEFEQLPTHRRATGSFCFFREYWDPKWTEEFAKRMLAYWFETLQVNVLVGMTPKMNRRAIAYCKRMGFQYTAELPGYTSFMGRQCSAMLAVMTQKDYELRYVAQG